MANIWEKLDNKTDLEGFAEDVKEAEENGGEFEDLPFGKYEVALESIEFKMSKTDKPMIVSTFKVVEGKHENRLIWYNQVVHTAATMAMGLRFINAMKPESEIKFKSYSQLAEELDEAGKYIPDNYEFVLDISKNKEYTNYKIAEVFSLED